MKTRRLVSYLLLALVLSAAPPCLAQDHLAGMVKDPTGRPLGEAEIWLYGFPMPTRPAAVTGPDGRFSLPEPLASSIEVCRAGFLPQEVSGRVHSAELLAVTLLPEAHLTGQVTGPDGEPVAGATITPGGSNGMLRADDRSHCPSLWPVRTDAAGRYTMDGFDPGLYFIFVDQPGLAAFVSRRVPVPAGATVELNATLGRGAWLAGQVRGPGDVPVAGAQVDVKADWRSLIAETGADGRYRVEGLPADTMKVEIRAENLKTATKTVDTAAGGATLDVLLEWEPPVVVEAPREPVAAAAEGPPPLAEARFQPPAENGSSAPPDPEPRRRTGLKGRIVGPLPGEVPAVLFEGPPNTPCCEDQDGYKNVAPDNTFSLENMAPGPWILRATADLPEGTYRIALGGVDVPPEGDPVTIDLDFEYGDLTLTVVLRQAGRNAEMRLLDADGWDLAGGDVPPDGIVRFPHLQPGTYHLRMLDAGGDAVAERDVTLDADLEVVLEPKR